MLLYVTNATSLANINAIQLLALDIKVNNPLLVLVTETWFTAKHEYSIVGIDNYTLYQHDSES